MAEGDGDRDGGGNVVRRVLIRRPGHRHLIRRPGWRPLRRPGWQIRRPLYRPRWGGPFEAWTRNFVARNHWRVRAIFDHDEAMQECAVRFAYCANLYAGRVDNPAWFMSIYTRAVIRHFHTLARRNARAVELRDAVATQRPHLRIDFSHGPLAASLGRASVELRQVFGVLANAPQELLSLMLGFSDDDEGAWSRGLCRLARISRVRSDLISELRFLLE